MNWFLPEVVIKNAIVVIIIALYNAITAVGQTVDQRKVAEGAYYDYRTWTVEIDGNRTKMINRTSLTVLDPKGDKYAGVFLHESRYAKLKRCDVAILDRTGNAVTRVDKNDMTKICGFGEEFQVYSDICYYDYEYTTIEYPYSITYEYEMELKSLFFWTGVEIQSTIPVDSASYLLTCPHDFRFHHKLYGRDTQPSRTTDNERDTYLWVLHEIPAYEPVPFAPDGYPELLALRFTADNLSLAEYQLTEYSWKGIGQWYADLAADCYDLEGTDNISVDTDPAKRAQEILEEITDKFRYVSVSIGMSGWKPHPAGTTIDNRYGDCKDLSTLLIARLRSAGIIAYPCLILTRGNGKLDTHFPSFEFNHVIAAAIIENDTVWMDPTCDRCPYGEIPQAIANLPALMVTDSGGILVTTTQSALENNAVINKLDLTLKQDLSLSTTAGIEYRGHYGRLFRNTLDHMDNDETVALIRDIIPGGGKRYRLTECHILNPDDRHGPFMVELSATRKRKLTEIDGAVYIRPDVFDDLDFYDSIELDGRTIPIDIGTPRVFDYRIMIHLDDMLSYDSIAIPSTDSVMYDFGKLLCTYECMDSVVKIDCLLTINGGIVQRVDFDEFDDFRKSVRDLTDQYVKIYK